MKVRFIKDKTGPHGVTLGKEYDTVGIDPAGNAPILDDNGSSSCLFAGEFEVIEE